MLSSHLVSGSLPCQIFQENYVLRILQLGDGGSPWNSTNFRLPELSLLFRLFLYQVRFTARFDMGTSVELLFPFLVGVGYVRTTPPKSAPGQIDINM